MVAKVELCTNLGKEGERDSKLEPYAVLEKMRAKV